MNGFNKTGGWRRALGAGRKEHSAWRKAFKSREKMLMLNFELLRF